MGCGKGEPGGVSGLMGRETACVGLCLAAGRVLPTRGLWEASTAGNT